MTVCDSRRNQKDLTMSSNTVLLTHTSSCRLHKPDIPDFAAGQGSPQEAAFPDIEPGNVEINNAHDHGGRDVGSSGGLLTQFREYHR